MESLTKKGHTLLESLIVVSIISLTFFSFKISFSARSLESLGYSVRSMFFLAKSSAIYTGRTYGIYFSKEGYIELYDSNQQSTVSLEGIRSGRNKRIQRININAFTNISYGIISADIPDPNNSGYNIPNHEKPIKMGNQNIMHIKPSGGVTNGSVYFTDNENKYMLCIRTAYSYTRIFLYMYNSSTGLWHRL